ncbi:protein [Escherichia coli]|uniref:Protein n=1 Tax=Escherichia coli TaxID=562 RepID=A0A376VPQ7_ECOLX|nr:protein [Escherichia coli]
MRQTVVGWHSLTLMVCSGMVIRFSFDDQGITVGQHLHIEMSRCRRWLSPTLQMTAVNFHLIAWQQWHDIIHQHLGENETLFNYCGDNPFYQALNKELHIKRRAVIQAVNDKQNTASAVASMMGLGIGLTPSARRLFNRSGAYFIYFRTSGGKIQRGILSRSATRQKIIPRY